MTEPANGSNEPHPATPEDEAKAVSLSRVIAASLLMIIWVLLYFNLLNLSIPAISLFSLLIGFFAPSVAAGILLKKWAFRRNGDSTNIARGFKIGVFFLLMILLPVCAFIGQIFMIVDKY